MPVIFQGGMHVHVHLLVEKLAAKIPSQPVIVVEPRIAEECKWPLKMQARPCEMIDLIGSEHEADIIQLELWRTECYTRFKLEYLPEFTRTATDLSNAQSAPGSCK